MDIAGARMLAKLCAELADRGAVLRLAEAHAMVRDILRAEGLEEKAGAISRRTSVEEVVDALLPDGTLARA